MDKGYIEKKVKELGPWYQRINLDGCITTKSNQSDITVWDKICNIVGGKEKFKNCNILDLGCNAGLYSVMVSLCGAKNIVGIELVSQFFNQAVFIKTFFEDKHKQILPITFIQKNISDIDFDSLGKFDYIFALSILYHIGKHSYGKYTERSLLEQEIVIEKLCKISSNIIVRARHGAHSNQEKYNILFNKFNFRNIRTINEGKRQLIHYGKF